MNNQPVPYIVDQHADEAAFLWLLRNAATSGSNYRLEDLVELDLRCEAHLDGLVVAGQAGLRRALLGLESNTEDGEAFTATVVSISLKSSTSLLRILNEFAETTPIGFGAAFSWLTWEQVKQPAQTSIVHSNAERRLIGISAYAAHRVDPGSHLQTLLQDPDPSVIARALRAAGELRRSDCIPQVRHHKHSEDFHCRFWAAWSLLLLGDKTGSDQIRPFVDYNSAYAEQAIRMVPRAMAPSEADAWLRDLAANESTRRFAIIGCGALGDSRYIPTLIGQMSNPDYARVAGEAFSTITGVDLAFEDLDLDQPDDFEAGPSESPSDSSTELDLDEGLPWPDPSGIESWWHKNQHGLIAGQKYLSGLRISQQNCASILRDGYQRHRIAAAYELALLNSNRPLYECAAPGFRQFSH